MTYSCTGAPDYTRTVKIRDSISLVGSSSVLVPAGVSGRAVQRLSRDSRFHKRGFVCNAQDNGTLRRAAHFTRLAAHASLTRARSLRQVWTWTIFHSRRSARAALEGPSVCRLHKMTYLRGEPTSSITNVEDGRPLSCSALWRCDFPTGPALDCSQSRELLRNRFVSRFENEAKKVWALGFFACNRSPATPTKRMNFTSTVSTGDVTVGAEELS